ncbi:restriction endonuclease subunit S [Psychrobacter sp. UBA6291]|uniref:restriction endonuclease subunit S n=1 Tax=Psychrobacter sp. UBA6291 TaxID=1947357 RepID=UPI00257DFC72|nr:restriction endonuclease subunit S [Psychrobacter sp. UBA6291]
MSEVKIPEGYKQTEVGVIPEDWDVKNFGDLFESSIPRKTIKPSNLVTFIGMQDVTENAQLAHQTIINYERVKSGFTYFEKGDVLLAKITPCFENGKGCHTKSLITKYGFGSTEFHVLRANSASDAKFIYFWTTRSRFRIDLESAMVGSAGHRRVPFSEVRSYQIPCPASKSEQTAIATALSDVDNLILSLEKLIAKKEVIKTGTMQQLLSGKTRLPEFATHDDGSPKGLKQTELGRIPEDWDYKALSEMTENKGLVRGPFGGALKKDSFVRTGFKVYEQRNAIYANTEIGKYYIDKDKFNELQRFTVKPKDFIVSCSGTIGRIYQIPVNAPEGIINQALLKITLNKNTDEHFFYQIFNSKEFQESITDSTQGGAMKNLIGMSEFKKSIMLMPSKPEQTAIATILSDMDVEIQALQQRLEKTRDIKQGMMQQLLTGKVRLAH